MRRVVFFARFLDFFAFAIDVLSFFRRGLPGFTRVSSTGFSTAP
jgi:hypothetical protein